MTKHTTTVEKIFRQALFLLWKNKFYLVGWSILYLFLLSFSLVLLLFFILFYNFSFQVSFVFWFLSIMAVVALSLNFNVGTVRAVIGLVDGERMGFKSLLVNFKLTCKVLLLYILFLSPILGLVYFLTILASWESGYWFLIASVFCIFLVSIYLSLRFIFSVFLLIDKHSGLSIKNSLILSWEKTEGNVTSIIKLIFWSRVFSVFFLTLVPLLFILFASYSSFVKLDNAYLLLVALVLTIFLIAFFISAYLYFQLICFAIMYRSFYHKS